MNRLCVQAMVILIPIISLSQSQVNRYFIYFNNKSGESYPYSISNPEEFLTPRAIDRREKQGIKIDESDLPVNPEYVQMLRDVGTDVFFTSRWHNGALVNADTTLLDDVEMLSFVDSIRWLADTTTLSNAKSCNTTPHTHFKEPTYVISNSNIQLMMLGVNDMHADGIKGQGMLIAVLDGGFIGVNEYTPFQHLWENDQIITTKDFVTNSGNVYQLGGHGTSVLSTMASNYRSTRGDMIGVVPEADYILCITEEEDSEDIVEEYNWMIAAEFADSLGADVINSSLGYRSFDISKYDYTYEDLDGNTAISSQAATMAASKGMVVVIAAGNDGKIRGRKRHIAHPADGHNILAVGSVNSDFTYSLFSSVGNTKDGRIKPEVAALGFRTTVISGNGVISKKNGTSLASPLVAGFAAGIWQKNPDWTSREVIDAIKKSGRNAHAPDSLVGYGVPYYTNIVDRKVLNVFDLLEDKVTIYPNPFNGNTFYLMADGEFKNGLKIKITDMKGTNVFNQEFKTKEIKKNMEITIDCNLQGVYFLMLQSGKTQKIVKLINF